ncbi:hypothetical protein DFJ75_3061 [Williamsia muralis]|uniref:Uncharacterized protein n=1 Tax=Williamsia marianensis TaxID=85044 RepID=A0A495K4V3_WILMA|nr:hypothetical protein [Williamsia muralis]RKR96221.1 hypothetical protein DFJ75_3061 [Williamsia muralis]
MDAPRDEESTVWLEDAVGNAIGISRFADGDDPRVLLTVPALGLKREIDAEDASRLIQMLQTGMSFSEITGDRSFRLDLNEL